MEIIHRSVSKNACKMTVVRRQKISYVPLSFLPESGRCLKFIWPKFLPFSSAVMTLALPFMDREESNEFES